MLTFAIYVFYLPLSWTSVYISPETWPAVFCYLDTFYLFVWISSNRSTILVSRRFPPYFFQYIFFLHFSINQNHFFTINVLWRYNNFQFLHPQYVCQKKRDTKRWQRHWKIHLSLFKLCLVVAQGRIDRASNWIHL